MNSLSRLCLAASILATGLTASPGRSASLTMTSNWTMDRTTPANLIKNGSFENGGPGTYWATGTTLTPYSPLPDWVSGGGTLNYASWCNTATNFLSDPLPDGTHGLYFGNAFVTVTPAPTFASDGTVTFSSTPVITHVSQPPSGYLPDVTLQQTISGLSLNKTYVLSFWASGEQAAAPNGYLQDGIFGLDVSGFPRVYLAVPHGGTGGIGSSHVYQFLLQPASSTTTVTFTNWGHFVGVSPLVSTTELVLDDVILNDTSPVPTKNVTWGQVKHLYK